MAVTGGGVGTKKEVESAVLSRAELTREMCLVELAVSLMPSDTAFLVGQPIADRRLGKLVIPTENGCQKKKNELRNIGSVRPR